jgi:hypothetical protein
MLIEKMKGTMTDGSEVFDLTICCGDDTITFECTSEKDADDLQFKLAVLISKHTNEQAVIK